MRVVILDEADDDLDCIYAWIAKDNPRAADAVIDRVLQSAEGLARFPHKGHKGRAPHTYEWMVKGLPYIIVYEVRRDLDEVVVIAVFHGAQDR